MQRLVRRRKIFPQIMMKYMKMVSVCYFGTQTMPQPIFVLSLILKMRKMIFMI